MYSSFPYDKLHTVNLGLIRSTFVWAMVIVHQIGVTTDIANYGNNMSLLDSRVQDFMITYAVFPCNLFKFARGVSHMFTTAKSQTPALGENNLSAGKVEAQKFPGLVFMLSVCIGTRGDIIPNRRDWSSSHLPPSYHNMNVTDVVQKALCSAAELCFALKCRDPTEKYLENLQKVC